MKKVILLALFFSFFSSSAVFAHTGLENATPEEGDVVTEEIQEIVLEFNTALEQASSFTVEDETGQEVPMSVEVVDQTMTGTLGAAAANGVYTVNWKIIGADGHPIDGVYTFTLDANEESGSSGTLEEAEEVTGKEELDREEPIDGNSGDQDVTEKLADENLGNQEETTNAPYVMVIVLLVLAVIAISTLMWVSNRRGD